MPSPYGKRTNVCPLLLVLNFSSIMVVPAGRIEAMRVSPAISTMKGALLHKTKTKKERLLVVGLCIVEVQEVVIHQSNLRLLHLRRRGLLDRVDSVEVIIGIAIVITIALR